MSEMSWKDAVIATLKQAGEALHYQEITERILSGGLRKTAGATPAATVNAQLAASIKHDGDESPFVRVAKGTFALRSQFPTLPHETKTKTNEPQEVELSGDIVRAFGMYWQRDLIVWRRSPSLHGRQQVGARSVDFRDQRGVYVLYDHHSVMYVGRALDRPLGHRLYEHTLDRLSGRWNRFSWFGLLDVSNAGTLQKKEIRPTYESVVATLEALLIETLEPPQNRKRGDDFSAIEYIQDIDPELKEQEIQRTLRNIEQKLRDARKE